MVEGQTETTEVPEEAETGVPDEAAIGVAETEVVVKMVEVEDRPGVPDTPPHRQKPVVTDITSMGTRLGTVWLPSRAHGRTK